MLDCLGTADKEDDNARTYLVSPDIGTRTIKIWSDAALQIVSDSRKIYHIFDHLCTYHPARIYGFAVDVLSIIFHSIAHRREGSCYFGLIHDFHVVKAGDTHDQRVWSTATHEVDGVDTGYAVDHENEDEDGHDVFEPSESSSDEEDVWDPMGEASDSEVDSVMSLVAGKSRIGSKTSCDDIDRQETRTNDMDTCDE